MPTKEQVKEALDSFFVPGVGRTLADLNLIRGLEIIDSKVNITLASAALGPGTQEWIKTKIQAAVEKLPEFNGVTVEFVAAKAHELNEIGQIVAILSGKGGVGKSLVTSLSAVALARQGKKVGILDADITGPSIPKMFGTKARPVGSETGILPIITHLGIEVMSINLLLENEDDAVIWRGPLIGGAIKQFWEETLWGKLDYLLVDLPPGTADASLTVMQSLPLSGLIIVSTPQDLANMVVRKAINMAQKMNIPIIGVVENMSYFLIPGTDKKIMLFGESKAEAMAKTANAPLLGQFPIDPELAKICDAGEIEKYDSDMLTAYTKSLLAALPEFNKDKK